MSQTTTSAPAPATQPNVRKWVYIGVAVVVTLIGLGSYNSLNGLSTAVDKSFAQIDAQLQRRGDLVPNIVESVKGEANFEKSTLEAVINARSRATGITMTPEMLNNPEAMKKFSQVQGDLTTALSRLMVVSEQYPQLRANQAFKDLRTTLEGTENRIGVARQRYNETTADYNRAIGNFPTVIVAKVAGYRHRPYFEADAASKEVPKVKF
jgi:LemA protein